MKLSDWAKKQGISYTTAFRWFKKGKIPFSHQMDTGTILVNEPILNSVNNLNIIYCRVSNQSRKKELQYQIDRCQTFCLAKGLVVNKVFKEVASGMNDNRKELWKMLNLNPSTIIVENKDRLTRFGFNYLQKLLLKQGCQIIIINEEKEDEQDLIKDMISIITSFCCRLYGLRRSKNKINKIKEILNDQNI